MEEEGQMKSYAEVTLVMMTVGTVNMMMIMMVMRMMRCRTRGADGVLGWGNFEYKLLTMEALNTRTTQSALGELSWSWKLGWWSSLASMALGDNRHNLMLSSPQLAWAYRMCECDGGGYSVGYTIEMAKKKKSKNSIDPHTFVGEGRFENFMKVIRNTSKMLQTKGWLSW